MAVCMARCKRQKRGIDSRCHHRSGSSLHVYGIAHLTVLQGKAMQQAVFDPMASWYKNFDAAKVTAILRIFCCPHITCAFSRPLHLCDTTCDAVVRAASSHAACLQHPAACDAD